MGFIEFLTESADAIADAQAHVKRCRQGLRDAQRTGDKDDTIEWEGALDDALEQLAQLKSAAKKKPLKESADIDEQIKAAEAKLKRAKFDLAHPEEGTRSTQFSASEDAVEQLEKQVKVLKDRRAALSKPVSESANQSDLNKVLDLMRKLEIYDADAGKAKAASPQQLSKMLKELQVRWEHHNK